jgi:hypothetical protein
MRSEYEATSLHLNPGLAGIKARLRSWMCRMQQTGHELRLELRKAKRAAATSGWWSDVSDAWPQEEFREGRTGI